MRKIVSSPMKLFASVICLLSGLTACVDGTNGIPDGFQPPSAPPPPPPPPPLKPVSIMAYAVVQGDAAIELLTGDNMALRFLALRQLAEARAISSEEAEVRANANKGALLPLTQAPPAIELDRPISPLPQIVRTGRLLQQGSIAMNLLLDTILQITPKYRLPLGPHNKVTARKLLARLSRLEATGLITPEERTNEAEALLALLSSDRIPESEVLPPPPPPLPEKPKSKGHGGGLNHRGSEPLYVPDPTNFDTPKLDVKASGQAGLYLMQVPDPSQADKAWTMLKTQSPELAALGVVLVRTDLGDVGVTWRLVAGPVTAEEAHKLCEGIRPKNQDCTPVAYPKNGTLPPPPKIPAPAAAAPAPAPAATAEPEKK